MRAVSDELPPELRLLARLIGGRFTHAELRDYRALHKHGPAFLDLDGGRFTPPCAFPGCAYGTEASALTVASRRYVRRLEWRSGPIFDWAEDRD